MADKAEAKKGDDIRHPKVIMLRQFMPSNDFVAKHVTGPGKGTKVPVARIVGVVTELEDSVETLGDGSTRDIIKARGIFSATNYISGEVSHSGSVAFPEVFSQKLKERLGENHDALLIDCDIAMEATGKKPAFQWNVTQHVEPAKQLLVATTLAGRERPEGIPSK